MNNDSQKQPPNYYPEAHKLPPNYYTEARIPAIDNTRPNMRLLYPVCESCPYKYNDNKDIMSLGRVTEEKQKHFDNMRAQMVDDKQSKKETFISENAPAHMPLNSQFKQGTNQYALTFGVMIGNKNRRTVDM